MREFPSPIGRIQVETDYAPLLVYLEDRLPADGFCGGEKTIKVSVHVGDAREFAADVSSEVTAQPRRVQILDCAFLVDRNSIEGVIPENSMVRGKVLEWIWYALPLFCCPGGWEAVHAAAVTKERGAIVIVGGSGKGKTTMVLRLLGEGTRFLADDIVLVGENDKVRGWGNSLHLCVDMARRLHADTTTLDAFGKCQWRPPSLAEWGEYPIAEVLRMGGGDPDLSLPIKGADAQWRPQVDARKVLFPPPRLCLPGPARAGQLRIALTNRNPQVYRWEGGDMSNLWGLLYGFRAAGVTAEFVPSDADPPDCEAVLSFHTQFDWARSPAHWGRPLIVIPITHGRPPREEVQEVVEATSLLLCYSEAEAQYYRDLFPEDSSEKFRVLPFGGQGVPASLYAEHEPVAYEPESIVMFGRYRPRKGQLQVLRVCTRLSVPVTFVGMLDAQDSGAYLAALRDEAGCWDKARFFSWMPQGEMLWRFLRRAHVHVNATLPPGEPFGLVSAEALAAGCNIVHTRQGWGSDLFAQYGTLCDPEDEQDIARAIMREMACTRDRHEFRPPTWDTAARDVLEAVEEALSYVPY